MSDTTMRDALAAQEVVKPNLDQKPHVSATLVFILLLVSGLGYAAYGIITDTNSVGEPLALSALVLLGVALMIALGFEFVNGFHDTANAVATVIYTHSLPPIFAVIWSGLFNFLGVLVSTGAVAYGIITLLPVELILQVGSTGGYAMIFALLIAAITWNLGTWALGIPNSSSHALIGSIMGVGIANQLMAPPNRATSGVDWSQAVKVGEALLFSPLCGFVLAGLLLLLLLMKVIVPIAALYREPKGVTPWWIRGILILTCTGVSFAHGGNDGQKGMGLIMLILIGVAPTAYSLNRTMPESSTPAFVQTLRSAEAVFAARAKGAASVDPAEARGRIGEALKTRDVNRPEVYASLASLSEEIANGVQIYGSIRHVVGERIGKRHLTYAQGASAEIVAAGTILGAEYYGLPVSTTHILSSGVAGSMAANGSGLQRGTVRAIVLAWVLTLPAAMAIAGCLYFLFRLAV
jgi:PiT family inorganic phosphate transporter